MGLVPGLKLQIGKPLKTLRNGGGCGRTRPNWTEVGYFAQNGVTFITFRSDAGALEAQVPEWDGFNFLGLRAAARRLSAAEQ